MGQTIIWVLLAVTVSHDRHGHQNGLSEEFVSAFSTADACYNAQKSMKYFTDPERIWTCEKELLK